MLLSDAVGMSGERALVGAGQHPSPWMETAAPLLAAALNTPATLLQADDARGWRWAVWQPGVTLPEQGEEQVFSPNRSLWARLVGIKPDTASARARAWALERGLLAVERVPGLLARPRVPVIDYVAVAQLDQRGLLVENSPRLYRFEISGPA